MAVVPRPLREDVAGAVQHVFSRGNRRQLIFLDDDDYELYLRLLAGIIVIKGWRLLAYCLMPNHVHLLIETPKPNLARGMQSLHGAYARLFNERYQHVGHLFQGRYGSKRMRDEVQLVTVAGYIARNPVKAGLCDEAGSWKWSSYPEVALADTPAWLDADRLLAYFAISDGDALENYVRVVNRELPSLA